MRIEKAAAEPSNDVTDDRGGDSRAVLDSGSLAKTLVQRDVLLAELLPFGHGDEPRVNAAIDVIVKVIHPNISDATAATIVDVSPGHSGLCLAFPEPVELGSLVQIRLGKVIALAEVRAFSPVASGFQMYVEIQDVFRPV